MLYLILLTFLKKLVSYSFNDFNITSHLLLRVYYKILVFLFTLIFRNAVFTENSIFYCLFSYKNSINILVKNLYSY